MKVFNTVEEMKQAVLAVDQIVETKGYNSAYDGGGANYRIAASQVVDGFGDHELANGNVALLLQNSVMVSKYGANNSVDSAAVIAADAKAFSLGVPLIIDRAIDISDVGNDYILFTANWISYNKSTVTFKNIQWVDKSNVFVKGIVFTTDAPSTGGSIAGYGGTNGFVDKIGNSGNIDFAAILGLEFEDNKITNTAGTTNCVKTEACSDVVVKNNKSSGGGFSFYGNKQNRVDLGFGIPTDNTRANVVSVIFTNNTVDGELISEFDLLNLFGGVGGIIKGNVLRNCLFDGMDLFTSGESLVVSGNTIYEVGHIGIQLKIDTNANDRDSLGAGLNRRVVISDNIIESVYPKTSGSSSGVTDVNGIMMLFSDDQGEIPIPTNNDFIRHVSCHDNIILGVNDDSEFADSDVRITGISCDVYMSSVHNNIISGVRRQPSQTATNTGNAISVNSVGVGPVNNVDIESNLLSAEINGIYINGTVSSSGRINNIRMNNNHLINSYVIHYLLLFLQHHQKD